MSHEDKIDPDGIRSDGVSYYEADAKQLGSYVDAGNALSQFSVSVLIHSNNPHEYLYIAAFDGTGNDKLKAAEHETNVAKIDDQIEALRRAGNKRFGRGYVPGPGTEDHFIRRVLDGAEGYTYNAEGLVAHATYTRPPLVAPGKVAQAVGMFDPVSTGAPMREEDRRLPPSVISGVQFIAANERR